MAEYVYADVGLSFKLAFELDFMSKIFHSLDPLFDQVKEDAFDLVEIFGGKRGQDEFAVVLMLKDGTSFVANNCQFVKSDEGVKIYPLHPSLFEEGKVWARAALMKKDELAFAIETTGFIRVCNG